MMRKLFILLSILLFNGIYAQNITNTPFGKGLINITSRDSSWSSKVSFRFQTRYDGYYRSFGPVFEDYSGRAYVRRARIKGDGYAFSPKLKYKFEYDVANGFVLDAVLKWNFHGNWVIWFGQTKLPSNIERVFSSQKLQLVDRSLLNSKFTLDRDAGVQLRHHFKLGQFLVREIVAISQGEGLNQKTMSSGNGYTGRIELLPFGEFTNKGDYIASDLEREETPKLMLGITYDFNHNAMRSRGQMGDYIEGELRSLRSIISDIHLKYRGFSLMSEYANRITTNGSPVINNNQIYYTGSAINLQMGYLTKKNWEIAYRYTRVIPEAITLNNHIKQYTFGFSKYIVGHNLKLQSDISYTCEDNLDDIIIFRLQTEFNF